jgi:hypothetical protein
MACLGVNRTRLRRQAWPLLPSLRPFLALPLASQFPHRTVPLSLSFSHGTVLLSHSFSSHDSFPVNEREHGRKSHSGKCNPNRSHKAINKRTRTIA